MHESITALIAYLADNDFARFASDLEDGPTLGTVQAIFAHPAMYQSITGPAAETQAAFFATFDAEMDDLGYDVLPALVEALMSGTPGSESYVGGAFLKAERAAKTVKIAVPSEDYVCYVQNLGSHCASLHSETRMFRASCCLGMPLVTIEIEMKGDEVDVWDQCYRIHDDGRRESLGNRCGAVQHYAEIAATAMAQLTVR